MFITHSLNIWSVSLDHTHITLLLLTICFSYCTDLFQNNNMSFVYSNIFVLQDQFCCLLQDFAPTPTLTLSPDCSHRETPFRQYFCPDSEWIWLQVFAYLCARNKLDLPFKIFQMTAISTTCVCCVCGTQKKNNWYFVSLAIHFNFLFVLF